MVFLLLWTWQDPYSFEDDVWSLPFFLYVATQPTKLYILTSTLSYFEPVRWNIDGFFSSARTVWIKTNRKIPWLFEKSGSFLTVVHGRGRVCYSGATLLAGVTRALPWSSMLNSVVKCSYWILDRTLEFKLFLNCPISSLSFPIPWQKDKKNVNSCFWIDFLEICLFITKS